MQSPRNFYVLPLALALLLACSNKGDAVTPDPGSPAPTDVTDAQPAAAPPVGTAPVPGPDGVPTNCSILHDGLCYQNQADACQVAGCPDTCMILETYPSQVQCPASGDADQE